MVPLGPSSIPTRKQTTEWSPQPGPMGPLRSASLDRGDQGCVAKAHAHIHTHRARGGEAEAGPDRGPNFPCRSPTPRGRRRVRPQCPPAGLPRHLHPGPEVRSSTGMGTKALEVLKAEAQPAPAQCPTKGSSRPLGSLGRFPPGRKPIFQNIPSVIQHGPQTAKLTIAEQILPHPGSGPGKGPAASGACREAPSPSLSQELRTSVWV